MNPKNNFNQYPSYLKSHEKGVLTEKIQRGKELLKECTLCPRKCKANRLEYDPKGKTDNINTPYCQTGAEALVSSCFPHMGEESFITGINGSGTIFFGSCNLKCVFCQNWDISHTRSGKEVTPQELADLMIKLQNRGCHNINFVTPSHMMVQILEALPIAIEMGLNIPLVYNTSLYDSKTSLSLLDDIIDIYMPDFKFWSKSSSAKYLNAINYPELAKRNLKLIYQQVGNLKVNLNGIAQKGLIVRHLVMPGSLDETRRILKFIKNEISPETEVNLMFQYRPAGKVNESQYNELNRILTEDERQEVSEMKKKG